MFLVTLQAWEIWNTKNTRDTIPIEERPCEDKQGSVHLHTKEK
jgi:hypothetical protein